MRKATKDDVSTIVTFVSALSREEGDVRELFTRRSCLRAGFRPDSPTVFVLAVAAEEPVGYASFFTGFDTGENYRVAYVMDLYVMRHHRRRGVATRLLRAVARYAGLRSRDRLCWGVLTHRRVARAFYESLGAEKDGFTPMSIAVQTLRPARLTRRSMPTPRKRGAD